MLLPITLLMLVLDEMFPVGGLDVFFSVLHERFSETRKLLIKSNSKFLF